MTRMVEVQQAALRDTLAVDQFRELGASIAVLPDGETFRDRVETDLWETFIGVRDPDGDTVAYREVPDESKSIIGYGEDGEEQVMPWWFQSFAWTVHARGEELSLTTLEALSQFENFDPQATTIQKPVLQDGISELEQEITDVLDAFDELSNAIDDRISLHDGGGELSLPNDIFEIEDQMLRTTEAFATWVDDLLAVCPPVNDALTGLLMVNTGVQREAVVDVVPDEVLDQLDALGFSDETIFEQAYFDPLTDIVALNSVFDRVVPGSADLNELGGLEALLYESWAQNNHERNDAGSEWIKRVASAWEPETLEPGEEPLFAEVAFQTPLRIHRDRVVYVTLGVTTKFEYYSSDKTKRKEIDDIMRSHGILEE